MYNCVPSSRLYGPYIYKGLCYKYIYELAILDCAGDQIIDDSSRIYLLKYSDILFKKYKIINVKFKFKLDDEVDINIWDDITKLKIGKLNERKL